MEAWIYRIMSARDPNWRNLTCDPRTGAIGNRRKDIETPRRER